MKLEALGKREAAVFASLADAYCAPAPGGPAVHETDAVAFVDRLAADSRRLNRAVFRLLLRAIDLAPLVRGYHMRFTRLSPQRRAAFVNGLDNSRWQLVVILSKLLKTLALMSYYGDADVLRAAGYDAEAVVARGQAARAEEERR
jgi:hypothetical protein